MIGSDGGLVPPGDGAPGLSVTHVLSEPSAGWTYLLCGARPCRRPPKRRSWPAGCQRGKS